MKNHDVRIDRSKLHPWIDHKLNLLLKECKKQGIYLIVTEGFRTVEYQDYLYAKGRTKPGKVVTNAKGNSYSSQHQWGIAFDIAINDKKLLYDDKTIKKVAKIAKSSKVGLAWGGDWKSIVDTPHFYLKKWGSTTEKLKEKYGTPDNFRKTFTAKVTGTKKGLSIWDKTHTKVKKKKLPNGTTVEVMYTKTYPFGKFAKVRYGEIVGLMKAKYLK
jgi:hypothetical protein